MRNAGLYSTSNNRVVAWGQCPRCGGDIFVLVPTPRSVDEHRRQVKVKKGKAVVRADGGGQPRWRLGRRAATGKRSARRREAKGGR